MDSCQRFEEIISDFIEGGVDRSTKAEMEQHIASCSKCTALINRLKQLRANLLQLPKPTVSQDFETILRARISMESGLARNHNNGIFSLWQFRIPVFAMSFVLIIAASLVVLSQINNSKQNYAPEAFVNQKWYGGPTRQNNQQSSERVIYFIERRPVHNVISRRTVSATQQQMYNGIITDTTNVNHGSKNIIERTEDIQAPIF